MLEEDGPFDGRAQRAPAQLVSLPPPGGNARDRQCRGATTDRARRAESTLVGLEVGGSRRAAGGVEGTQLAPPSVVDQPEAVAADTVHVRIDDRDGRRGGNGGVDGVAAPSDDRRARFG